MKTKCIKIFSSLVLILLVSFVCFCFSNNNPHKGVIKLDGITSKVTITRDQHGVPHIEAQNDEDAFFALGYIHAQDRFWQMEFQRHIAQGSLSEMFGEATIAEDKFLRTLGFYRAAISAWPALSPKSQTLFHSYTQGVNSFLATGNLPIQFKLLHYSPKPWLDVDSIAWQKMMAWDLQSTWKEKIENAVIAKQFGKNELSILLPAYPKSAPTILSNIDLQSAGISNTLSDNESLQKNTNDTIHLLTHFSETIDKINKKLGFNNIPGKGSNNWVVSGKLTQSHQPILASDPHLGLSAPNLWYLADIKTPNFHSIGASIPGLPAIIIGHNDYIAWGVTNGCVDAQDLYIESSENQLHTIDEIIKIKDKADIHYPVRISQHGPIISDISNAKDIGKNVALQWVALMPNDTTMQSFLEINYAKNWDEFKVALNDFISPSQNFVYADVKGNIGYYLSGKLPIREGWTGALPVDSKENKEWHQYIPFNKMPHTYNPAEGYIVSANNKVASDNYSYNLTSRCAVSPYRAERIIDLIKQKNNHITVTDMEVIQNDTVSYLWKDLKDLLLKTSPENPTSQHALTQLAQWDGDMNRKSQSATLFAFWYTELSKMTPPKVKELSEWAEPLFIKQQLTENGKYCKTDISTNCTTFLSHTLAQATLHFEQQKKPQWGDIHHAVFEESGIGSVNYLGWIWNRNIASAGDPYTVNVGSYHSGTYNQIEGAGYRQIVDLNNFDNSKYIQALGQSNALFDSHYDDLMNLWRDGKYLSMTSTPDKKASSKILILQPAERDNTHA